MNLKHIPPFFHKHRILLSVFSILLVFRGYLEELISSIIVNPIISNFEVDWLSNILLILLLVLVIYAIVNLKKRNYLISQELILISIFTLITYFYYRFFNEQWIFFSLHKIQFLKYLDVIPIIAGGVIYLRITFKTSTISETNGKGFILDNPIESDKQDLLNRRKSANYIACKIKDTNSNKGSFAIGISGMWGSGKTSFLSLIEGRLDFEEKLVIHFNPWKSRTSVNIVKDFFNEFSDKLSKYNSSSSSLIDKYMSTFVDSNISNVSNVIKLLFNTNPTNKEFEEINEVILKMNKKIIVFIDDLDRLNNDEVLEIMKLIRNSGNFKNTFFIVAYDRNYVVNSIKKFNEYSPDRFIEKIFQIEFPMPNYEIDIILSKIYDLIKKDLTNQDAEEINNIFLKQEYYKYLENKFYHAPLKTVRDAIRFANSFLVSYNFLKGEVDIIDLLNIEILRLKYQNVYSLLFSRHDDFLVQRVGRDNWQYFSLKKNSDLAGFEKENNNKDEFYIREYLLTNSSIEISRDSISEIIKLLLNIFPEYNEFFRPKYRKLSVINPISFDRYSFYRLLDSNLSEVEFSNFRMKSISEFHDKISDWVKKGLRNELTKRFESLNSFSGKEDFEKVISAIFYLSRIQKIDNIKNDHPGFDYNNLLLKISSIELYLRLEFYKSKEEYIVFLISLFESAKFPYTFESEFIFNTLENNTNTYAFIIPKNTLENLRLKYFKNYLSETDDIDMTLGHLLHYNKDFVSDQLANGSSQVNITYNDKSLNYLKKFIKNEGLDNFLQFIIVRDNREESKYAIREIVKSLYGSYEEFGSFIDEFKVEDFKYLGEFKKFFDLLRSNGFTSYIDFEFKDITVKKLS